MAGRQVSEWDVLNCFLVLVIGGHRGRGWSLGPARDAAARGIWDSLVMSLIATPARVVTDSNMHTSCVYEISREGDCLLISTVLPYFAIWDESQRCFVDQVPSWATCLLDVGFSFLGERASFTLSPYRDEKAGRRLTYSELLFEWTEGSDAPSGMPLTDPWSGRVDRWQR